jgi:hypothetical protein
MFEVLIWTVYCYMVSVSVSAGAVLVLQAACIMVCLFCFLVVGLFSILGVCVCLFSGLGLCIVL